MTVPTAAWDVLQHLDSEAAVAAYLDAVFEDGDPALIKAAIGDVVRAQGNSDIAARAYQALMERLEDAELNAIADARIDQLVIKVTLDAV